MNRDDWQHAFPPMARVRFHLVFESGGTLPHYPGSALRGVVGHGLRRVVCVTGQRQCDGCLLQESCFYHRFFETPQLSGGSGVRLAGAPHPWALAFEEPTPRVVQEGTGFSFVMLLLDHALENFPYLLLALERAGAGGIGRGRARFGLQAVEAEQGLGSDRWQRIFARGEKRVSRLEGTAWVVPERPERMELCFQTPLRLQRYGNLVGPAEFAPQHLFEAVRRRVHDILLAYGNAPGDSLPLARAMSGIPARFSSAHLEWRDWTRYSSRQQARMQMGGLIGSAVLEGEQLPPEGWPLLWLGQWLHAGKQSSMGLGQYRIMAGRKLAIPDRPENRR